MKKSSTTVFLQNYLLLGLPQVISYLHELTAPGIKIARILFGVVYKSEKLT